MQNLINQIKNVSHPWIIGPLLVLLTVLCFQAAINSDQWHFVAMLMANLIGFGIWRINRQDERYRQQEARLATVNEIVFELLEAFKNKNELDGKLEAIRKTSPYLAEELDRANRKFWAVMPGVSLEVYRSHLKRLAESAKTLLVVKQGLPGAFVREFGSEGGAALKNYLDTLNSSQAQMIRLFIVSASQLSQLNEELQDQQLMQTYHKLVGENVHSFWTTREDIKSHGNVLFDGLLFDRKIQIEWDEVKEQMKILTSEQQPLEPGISLYTELLVQVNGNITSQKFRAIQYEQSLETA